LIAIGTVHVPCRIAFQPSSEDGIVVSVADGVLFCFWVEAVAVVSEAVADRRK